MNAGINKVVVLGKVIKKPHVIQDKKIVNFKVETITDQIQSDGTIKTVKEVHKIVAEERFIDIVNKLVDKGTTVFIEGTLNYKDKELSPAQIFLGNKGKLQVLDGFKKVLNGEFSETFSD